MNKWSYTELQKFIHEDIAEFMGDGLNIRQASSRIQVEYANPIEESELEKLIIFMALCEEGIKHGFLREDIKSSTLDLISNINFDTFNHQLTLDERLQLRTDIDKTLTLLSENR